MAGLTRHSLIAATGALCSRVLGFVRDASMAWLFGASATGDALATALRLPYLVRRLYGEGALSLELTAHCVRARYQATPDASSARDLRLAAAVGRLAAGWGVVLLIVGLLAARPLMLAFAPGLSGRPDVLNEAVSLFRICLPYVPVALLAAVCMAALHSREIFAVPSLTPGLFNITVIVFVFAAACGWGNPGIMVAVGVLCGGLIQWGAQIPAVCRMLRAAGGRQALASQSALRAEARAVARRLPLGLLSASVPQLVFLVSAMLTSWLPDGSLAALFYAERLMEFPIGVLGAAVGMAAAPALAASAAVSGAAALRAPVSGALRLALMGNLPAAAGLMAVAVPLTDALFGHGAFSQEAVRQTALVLCAYAPGLPAYAASRPLLAACHALEDRATPLRGTWAGLVACLAAGGTLMWCWGPVGPPLGASIGLWCYTAMLWRGVRSHLPEPGPFVQYGRLAIWLCGSGLAWLAASGIVALCSRPLVALLLAVPGGIMAYGLSLLVLDVEFRGLCSDRLRKVRRGAASN